MVDLRSDAHPVASAIATLRERLDLECTETDAHGRYVLDWDAMNEVVDAIDEIEEAFSADEEDGE